MVAVSCLGGDGGSGGRIQVEFSLSVTMCWMFWCCGCTVCSVVCVLMLCGCLLAG